MDTIKDYYKALDELMNEGAKITLNAVAIRAGRGNGAIKGNSPEILELRAKILTVKKQRKESFNQHSPTFKISEALRIKKNYQQQLLELKNEYNAQAAQLASALFELAELKLELQQILNNQRNVLKIK